MTAGGNLLRDIAVTAADRVRGSHRDLSEHFLSQSAISARRGVAYSPPSPRHAREFARMVDAGVLRKAYGKLYYLDRAAVARRRERLTRTAVPWVIAACVAAALFATRFYVDASRTLH